MIARPSVRLLALASAAAMLAPMARAADPAPGLTLAPTRSLAFDAHEGTWMAPDIAPDGRTILFDLLGDIYALDAAGGAARPILTGMAYETQPVISPDGTRFAFLSDRSGSTNLWVADIDGTGLRQLSHDTRAMIDSSPAWAPDGRSVYVSRTHYALLAFELFRYDAAGGGAGVQITKAQPGGNEGFDERINALGAVASPDGRFLYFARKVGTTWSEKPFPNWSIVRHDLATGKDEPLITGQGGAMRPALSHDGHLLAYASREGEQTGLRLRDLDTGADRWLRLPIDHDSQDQGYYADLEPRFAFAQDDRSLILSVNGKLARLALDGTLTDIPFTAPVKLGLGPQLRVDQPAETGPVKARIIQAPRLSPDGRWVAFAALGTLYRMELRPGARPEPVVGVSGPAYQPSWSPDGKRLAYVTWSAADAGHIWSVPAAGGKPQRLTGDPAYYTEPVFSPDGHHIVALRASQYDRLHAETEISQARPTDIVLLAAGGGAATLVAYAYGAHSPSFSADGRRICFDGEAGLESVALDGSDDRHLARIVGQSMSQYVEGPDAVQDARLDPSGTRALVKAASELYLVDLPPANAATAPTIDLGSPATHVVKLTRIGADYADWSPDGRSLTWSVGATFHRLPLAQVIDAPGASEAASARFAATVELPRDVPHGTLLLHGATAITMRGDEVIADADILVVDDHIAAIGKAGSLAVPAGTTVRDVTGKFITPGFVDTHAHWFEIRRELFDRNHWDFLANLAYGVTSGLDVQAFTVDIFSYQDMIDAGLMTGPRAFSVGPGVFVNSTLDSRQAAIDVLTRYRDDYRTRNIKSYMVGDRDRRQFMIEASKELGMMPTTEGASNMVMDITHAMDGFAGNEHAIPVTPLHDDVVRLFAASRTSYTPTLDVVYGAKGALDDMIVRHRPDQDAKLATFVPPWVIEARMAHVTWRPSDKQDFPRIAHDALAIQRAGGLVGIGSHGTIQGLGYRFELEAYAAGGATPMEVLHAATIGSAEVIGHASQIGSLEPGKFADLLVMDRNPLETIANTGALSQVMKNGRLYDAASLDEIWPRPRRMPAPWWRSPSETGHD